MKLLPKILGLLLVCQSPFLMAEGAFDSCNVCCMDLSYDVFVDYLYWKVCRTDLNLPSVDSQRVEYINPGYESGYRLGGKVGYGCWDLGVRYTSYDASTTRGFSNNQGGTYKMDLDVVDIEVGYTHHFNCMNGFMRPVVGAKLAWIDETENFVASGSNKTRLDACGYGLYMGVEGSALLFDCFLPVSLVGRATLGILDTEFDFKIQQGTGAPRQNECVFTPVHELYVGLEFSFDCFSCLDAAVQVGYEVQGYTGWRTGSSPSEITALGLGGLVVHIELGF